MATSDKLSGFDYIGQPTLTDILRTNLITFFDWGFVDKGGYWNNTITTSGIYGGNWNKLKPVRDPNYTNGRVWGSKRKNWVWETGTSKGTPIAISGIFVNDNFLPYGSGYYVDYINGQVIFDSARSLSDTVQLEYSFKWINVMDARAVPWIRKLQTQSFRVDDAMYIVSSGENIELAQSRIQLPAVAIELVVDRRYKGHALGGYGKNAFTDVIYHVIAEDDTTVGHLLDIISMQDDKTIFVFSPERMANNNAFPLDSRGEISSGVLTYPNLVQPTGDGGFRCTDKILNGKLTFSNTRASNGQWLNSEVYTGTVRMTTEVVLSVK